jgi:PadR family transcriptional regulator PadR
LNRQEFLFPRLFFQEFTRKHGFLSTARTAPLPDSRLAKHLTARKNSTRIQYISLTATLQCHILCAMDNRFFDNWATQLRKGMLELCILNAIKGTTLYGYDIVRKLRDINGLVISEGTIYPILSRLKREGFVRTTIKESTEGPARKYYALTAKGEKTLSQMNHYWHDMKSGAYSLTGG